METSLQRSLDSGSVVEHRVACRCAAGDRLGYRRYSLMAYRAHGSAGEKRSRVHVLDFFFSSFITGCARLDITSRRQVWLAQPVAADAPFCIRADLQRLLILGNCLGAHDHESR